MPSESKDEAAGTLLGRAVDFYRSNKLSEPLEGWARSHAVGFEEAVAEESKTGEPLHKLEYTQLHQEYLALFEDLLNSFLHQEGCSPQTFYR
eukprot:13167-Heterococcus_DN1.PRE.1